MLVSSPNPVGVRPFPAGSSRSARGLEFASSPDARLTWSFVSSLEGLKLLSCVGRAPHSPAPGPNLHWAFPTEWQTSALHLRALNPIYLLSASVPAGPAPSSSYPPPLANLRPFPLALLFPFLQMQRSGWEQPLEVSGKVLKDGGSDLEGRGQRRV